MATHNGERGRLDVEKFTVSRWFRGGPPFPAKAKTHPTTTPQIKTAFRFPGRNTSGLRKKQPGRCAEPPCLSRPLGPPRKGGKPQTIRNPLEPGPKVDEAKRKPPPINKAWLLQARLVRWKRSPARSFFALRPTKQGFL